MLGNNAFLLEQLGLGHTSLGQVSTCTLNTVVNYIKDSAVGVFDFRAAEHSF